jgi:NAD(P)-dependent dehydrogenase (short-subunit alcohol dehydrogenase family)
MKTMADKRVLVTGAGTGIGRGIALAFAAEGAIVALHYSRSGKGAETAVEEILAGGGKAAAFKADFSEVEPLQALARDAVAFLGGVDVLVNNAGISMTHPFEKTTAEQFDLLYAVNVRAPYFLSQALLPELEVSRGVIINLSSIHALEGCPQHSVYAGTRGAIMSFTRELAIELGPRGVRVVGIAPGAVPVPNHYHGMSDAEIAEATRVWGNAIPCGFAGTPEDIGNVALFLASEASRYIVGQTLVVDGGTTSWMPFGTQFKEPPGTILGKGYVPGL